MARIIRNIPTELPNRFGYQLWETEGEERALSPVFLTLSDLIDWMRQHREESTEVEKFPNPVSQSFPTGHFGCSVRIRDDGALEIIGKALGGELHPCSSVFNRY
jgi:hypothetical protein